MLSWKREKLMLFKSLVFTLLKSLCSSSKFDRAGFKCLLAFPTGHFCCFGTGAHTGFQYQWDTTSNAALNWQHSWVVLNVYQLSRSKVCRHWVEQQYATKLTVVLLEKKKGRGREQLSVKIKAAGPMPEQTISWFIKYRISRSQLFRKGSFAPRVPDTKAGKHCRSSQKPSWLLMYSV